MFCNNPHILHDKFRFGKYLCIYTLQYTVGAGFMPALTGIQCYQKRAVDVAVPEFPDINYPVRLPELLRNVGEIVHGFASFIICIYTVECYYGKEGS